MRRPCSLHRYLTAFAVIASLLFSQLAFANYVCPGQTSMTTMPDMAASGMPCEGMDEAQPVLCHQHAASAPQSIDVLKVLAPTVPIIVQVLVVPRVVDVATIKIAIRRAIATARPPPDPLFLSTLRLRV